MESLWSRAVLVGGRACRALTLPKVAVLLVALSALTYAVEIPIFFDDFEQYDVETNPGVPIVGEPWQISEAAPEGIEVSENPLDPDNLAMRFGSYRNIAVAPFSAASRQLIATAQSVTVSFDYTGFEAFGYSHYFDVAAYDPASGDEAFFLRFVPPENAGQAGLHDVLYLDPVNGLVDSGLDVLALPGNVQPITIIADFSSELYQLDIAGDSVELPMFVCPNEIAGVEFSNYGVALGSGSIDNLSVTVPEPDAVSGLAQNVPETATVLLLLVAALALASARLFSRKGK